MVIEEQKLSKIKHLYEIYFDGTTFHKTKRKVAYSNSEYFYLVSEKNNKRLLETSSSKIELDLTSEQVSRVLKGFHVWTVNEPVLDKLELKIDQINRQIKELETQVYSYNSQIKTLISKRDRVLSKIESLELQQKELKKEV